MLDACGDDEHVVWAEVYVPISELDDELPTSDHEEFIGVWMSVPDELAKELHNFHVVVVDARQASRLPVLGNKVKGISYVTNFVCHAPRLSERAASHRLNDSQTNRLRSTVSSPIPQRTISRPVQRLLLVVEHSLKEIVHDCVGLGRALEEEEVAGRIDAAKCRSRDGRRHFLPR